MVDFSLTGPGPFHDRRQNVDLSSVKWASTRPAGHESGLKSRIGQIHPPFAPSIALAKCSNTPRVIDEIRRVFSWADVEAGLPIAAEGPPGHAMSRIRSGISDPPRKILQGPKDMDDQLDGSPIAGPERANDRRFGLP